MANQNTPNGFLYTSCFAPRPPHCELFEKPVGATVGIFQGDVVYELIGATGFTRAPIKSYADGATVGTTIPLGVALEFGAANLRTRHHVIIERGAYYHAQDNDPTTGLVATDTNKNAHVDVASVAGGVIPFWSGMQIDKSGVTAAPNTTSTFELALKGLWQGDPNNAFGPHARFLCKFNQIHEGEGTTGV